MATSAVRLADFRIHHAVASQGLILRRTYLIKAQANKDNSTMMLSIIAVKTVPLCPLNPCPRGPHASPTIIDHLKHILHVNFEPLHATPSIFGWVILGINARQLHNSKISLTYWHCPYDKLSPILSACHPVHLLGRGFVRISSLQH